MIFTVISTLPIGIQDWLFSGRTFVCRAPCNTVFSLSNSKRRVKCLSGFNTYWTVGGHSACSIRRVDVCRRPSWRCAGREYQPAQVVSPGKGRARLRTPDEPDGTGHPYHRHRLRQSGLHAGEYGLQHGTIVIACQLGQARMAESCPVEAETDAIPRTRCHNPAGKRSRSSRS